MTFNLIAVLVNNTLVVLFGKGLDGTLQPSILMVDVGNVANLSYTATFDLANNILKEKPQQTGLSKGAIGGIAAGTIILVSYIFQHV